MDKKKKILILDVPGVVKVLEGHIERWGYEAIATSSADSIEEVVARNDIGLIILAKEMTTKGPSLLDYSVGERWPKGAKMEVDFEFGRKVSLRLRGQNINLPVIFLTTESVGKPRWFRDEEGKFCSAVVDKRFNDLNTEELKKMIEECFGETRVL